MLKTIKTNEYVILFDTKTGMEITDGINGHSDPFVLNGPSLIDIGIKGNCSNNDCIFCYQGSEQRPDMTLDNYISIINQVKPYTNQIALGGKGNPNEHPQFKEIINYTIQNGIVPNYTTSGMILTDEQVEISKKCGAVAVSIGNIQPYTYTAIKKFQDAGIKTNLHWVLSKKSMGYIISVLNGNDIWEGKINLNKINAIVLLSFKSQGRGVELDGWSLDDNDVKRFIPYLRNQRNKFKIGADSCLFCKIGRVDTFTKEEQLFTDTCEASRCSCYISCDMLMMPCSYGNREEYGVSLKNNSIKEIWNDSCVFKDFRECLTQNPYQCPYGF